MSWLRKLFGGGVEDASAAPKPPAPAVSLAGQTLVVADPSVTIHKVAEMVLGGTGCEVAFASQAGEILPLVWKTRPGTVLVDASFLRDDQLVPAIRKAVAGVRVVLLRGTFEHRDPAAEQAVDGVLTKPFSPQDLLATVAPVS